MRALLAVLALAAAHAQAQSTLPATPSTAAPAASNVVPIALQVERLAPQLLAFAGSRGNFENLVNGLALGVPVTLTTVGADGLIQTVTFSNPGGALSDPAEIARVLEGTRQQLIAGGVAVPTAQQLGEAISGTTVPVSVSTIPQPASAAAGASPAQQIQSRNSTPVAPQINTSDSRTPGNTSNTPTPPSAAAAPPAPAPAVRSSPSLISPPRR